MTVSGIVSRSEEIYIIIAGNNWLSGEPSITGFRIPAVLVQILPIHLRL